MPNAKHQGDHKIGNYVGHVTLPVMQQLQRSFIDSDPYGHYGPLNANWTQHLSQPTQSAHSSREHRGASATKALAQQLKIPAPTLRRHLVI